MQITKPTDVRHEMHVTYDPAASEIVVSSHDPSISDCSPDECPKGLPESWIQTFASWGLGPHLENPISPVESQLASPMTGSTTSPLSVDSFDSDAVPLMPERRPRPGRQRSASAAVVPSMAPSIDHFRSTSGFLSSTLELG